MIKEIVVWPDKKLAILSKNNNYIQKNIYQLMEFMITTMYLNKGIGIASIQLGIPINILMVNTYIKNNNTKILINTKLLNKYNKIKDTEGCLSVPQKSGFSIRYKMIDIKYMSINQKYYQTINTNFSTCLQHELSHSNGKLWIQFQPINGILLIKKEIKFHLKLKYLKS